jgi:hypothetical protein
MIQLGSREVIDNVIGYQMLSDLSFAVMKAILDEISEDEYERRYDRHMHHAMVAATFNLKEMGVIEADGPLSSVHALQMLGFFMAGHVYEKVEEKDGVYVIHVKECGTMPSRSADFRRERILYCRQVCERYGTIGCEAADDRYRLVNMVCKDGQGRCVNLVLPRDSGIPPLDSLRGGKIVPPVEVDEEKGRFLLAAYKMECWALKVRMMVETTGSEHTMSILAAPMREVGVKWGKRLSGTTDDLLRDTLQAALLITRPSVDGRFEVSSCLLSAAPKEACLLFNEFLNGLLEGEGKGRTLEMLSCIPRGEEACGYRVIGPQLSSGIARDPLSILKERLARGEITIEEYEKVKRALED